MFLVSHIIIVLISICIFPVDLFTSIVPVKNDGFMYGLVFVLSQSHSLVLLPKISIVSFFRQQMLLKTTDILC